ncbi:MAG: hypothetical protein HYZ51_02920 [Candidatus Doudnabacteria bacterium]|nr:hypothetical protein [Candidatus Doudnabacteria bacterium]
MKTKLRYWIMVAFAYSIVSSVFAQQKDIDAIKAVIAKETSSFMNVDFKTWEETWLKVPYAYWSYSDSSATSYVEGWEALTKTFAEYFKTAKPSKASITNEWQEIRVYGNGAYARFIQRVKDDIDRDETSQMRVLEKTKDGKWKVICVGAIAKYPKE